MAAIGINGVGCLKRLTLQKFEDGKRRKRGGGGLLELENSASLFAKTL